MPVLQFEHQIKDFAMWKAAFDRDPIDRRGLGVRRHRVYRPVDDPNYVVGELEFPTRQNCRGHRRPGVLGLSEIPELVRRYADAVIQEPTKPVHRVKLTQTGEMILKPGGRRVPFEATEEFAVDSVAFAWRARFPILGPLSMHVTDSYQAPDGLLEVKVLGVPVRRNSGPELAAGEVFRYLAEIPWVPQAIRANPELQWRAIDDRTAEVSTLVAGERTSLRFTFERGEIVRTDAHRPRLESGGKMTPWVGEFGDYRTFNGVRMPARGEVAWVLPEGPFTYWRGTITSVEAGR